MTMDDEDEPPPHVKKIMEATAARAKKAEAPRLYPVGFGKPPVDHRFKKGQPSPNPRGRPRKDKRFQQALEEAFARKVPVKIGGKTKRMSAREVTIQQFLKACLAGEEWAIKLKFKLSQELEPFVDKTASEAELAERRALSAKLTGLLEAEANRTKPERPRGPKPGDDDPDGSAAPGSDLGL